MTYAPGRLCHPFYFLNPEITNTTATSWYVLESADDREGEPTKTTAAGTAIGRLGRIGDGGGEERAGMRGEEVLEAIGEGEEGDEVM